MMTESSTESLRRRALHLVLEKKFQPGHVAKLLQCTSRTVQQWINEAIDQQLLAPEHVDPFVPVLLDAEPAPEAPTSIPLDILTPTGLTLRLQLPSLRSLADLLHVLEADSC